MKKNLKNIIIVALMGTIIFGLGLWSAVRGADDFSVSERRPLAQFPSFSLEGYKNGEFMDGVEEYAPDQFPLREKFRTLKSLFTYYVLNQKDNNDVYVEGGYAAKLDFPLDVESLDNAAAKLESLYDRYFKDTDVNLYMSVIPDKNHYMQDADSYPHVNYTELTGYLKNELSDKMEFIDIEDTLTIEDYYATDSHWRQECILDTADRLAEAMGVKLDNSALTATKLDNPYYGVYYGYAALPMPAETIYYMTGGILDKAQVMNYETGKLEGIYNMDKANGRDPYEMFLSGSVSLLTMENPEATTDKELVIFRDSFGSSISPLLLSGYSKVTLVDIRYLASPLVGNFIDFVDQDVLFLYSSSVLNNSETLK